MNMLNDTYYMTEYLSGISRIKNDFRATYNKYWNWKDLKIYEWLNIDLYIHLFKPQLDVQNQKIILIKIQQIFMSLIKSFFGNDPWKVLNLKH